MVEWDTAFHDRSGSTLIHYVAHYLDGRGQVHRLESWRLGQLHLRRKTDDRIDLHADAVSPQTKSVRLTQPLEYVWQIVDLTRQIDHRVSTAGMMHLGMLYSYYSMAHVLSRPAGNFTVHSEFEPIQADRYLASTLSASTAASIFARDCTWWQIDAQAQPSMRVCWMERYGIPARTYIQTPLGWRLDFQVDRVSTDKLPAGTFAVDTAGLKVRDVDEIESED